MKLFLFFALNIGLFFNTFSQTKPEPFPDKRSYLIIQDGITLHDDSLYLEALEMYKLISPNDSNYSLAQSEMAFTLIALEEYDQVIELCEKALENKNIVQSEILERLALAYDEVGESDKSIATYTKGIEIAPMSYMMYFNRGVTYLGQEKYKEAISDFKSALEINPKHASSHYQLGMYALQQGELVPATMALGTFFMFEPSSERAFNALVTLNNALSEKQDYEDYGYPVAEGENFKQLEVMVSNYIALRKDYKVQANLTPPVIKQMHFIYSKTDVRQKGFFTQMYLPFFKQMVNNKDLFNGFSYLVLATSGNKKHQKQITKDKNTISKFIDWANAEWVATHLKRAIEWNGEETEVNFWRTNSGWVEAIGKTTKEGNPIGYYRLFYSSGNILEEGVFNNTGEREGEWKEYYKTGRIKEIAQYKKGNYNGPYQYFENDGSLSISSAYADGALVNTHQVYYPTGKLYQKSEYTDGKYDGEFIRYYPVGGVQLTAEFELDNLEESIIRYYPDGTLDSKTGYNEGLENGPYEEYYDNGAVYSKYTYVDGKLDGKYILYYRDGQIRKEGENKEGKSIGLWNSYNQNGTLDYSENFDETGKQNGVYTKYDYAGRKVTEVDYSKGEITGYRMFDEKGEIIKQAKAKKGKFMYFGMHANRAKAAEGMYDDGEKSGEWNYYNEYGSRTSTANYTAGQEDGEAIYFSADAKLKSKDIYKEGQLQGASFSYWPNGNISEQGRYVNGKAEGQWVNYAPDGATTIENFFVGGELNGWQIYYNNAGVKTSEVYYRESLIMAYKYFSTDGSISGQDVLDSGTGVIKSLFPNGKLSFKSEIKNGYYHGLDAGFYPNGNKRYEMNYAHDKREGSYYYYYQSGKISTQGNYFKGKKHGEWKSYHENGKLANVGTYEYGMQQGEKKFYTEKGKLTRIHIYSFNQYDGPQRYYSDNAELQMIRNYNNGILESYSYLDENGKELAPILVEYGNGEVECKYSNGNISRAFTYKHGEFEGLYSIYHFNGQLADEFHNVGGLSHGVEKEFYTNGQLFKEYTEYYDLQHGLETTYHENGEVKSTINYVYGEIEGESKHYDTKGQLIRTEIWFNNNIYEIK